MPVLYPSKQSFRDNKYDDDLEAVLNYYAHLNFVANQLGNGETLVDGINPRNAFDPLAVSESSTQISVILDTGECVINGRYYRRNTTVNALFDKSNVSIPFDIYLEISGDPAEFKISTSNKDDKTVKVAKVERDSLGDPFILPAGQLDGNEREGEKFQSQISARKELILPHSDVHQFGKFDLRDAFAFSSSGTSSKNKTVTVNASSTKTITVDATELQSLNLEDIYQDASQVLANTVNTTDDVDATVSDKSDINNVKIDVSNNTSNQKTIEVSVIILTDLPADL
jgi:hypothetical protein